MDQARKAFSPGFLIALRAGGVQPGRRSLSRR